MNADLLLHSLEDLGGTRRLRWWSVPDVVYDVLFTSNLVDDAFTCIVSNLPADPCINAYDDDTPLPEGSYRVRERGPVP